MNLNQYRDYTWKNGIPYGIIPADQLEGEHYHIAMDPYRKRISIEKYVSGDFKETIYDSILLDFRHLKLPEQLAWQKISLQSLENQETCLIRNQDNRALFLETYHFQNGLCRECHVTSIHGIPVSVHRMHYTSQGDSFNGVILFDVNSHPVMSKHYEVDSKTGEFTDLISENWAL